LIGLIKFFFYFLCCFIESIGSPYGGSPAVPGSIFYTHSVSVSAAHSAASAGYQLPPGSMYSYPNHSATSRPTYSVQTPTSSKDDVKHHAVYVGQGNVLPQNAQRGTISMEQPLFHYSQILLDNT
jgi:hypothetical protein